MRGPYFNRLLEASEISLEKGESLADLEEMYTLILRARGIEVPDESDERFALVLLCKVPYPGKMPKYSQQMAAVRRAMRGISDNERLQIEFRAGLQRSALFAARLEDLNLQTAFGVIRLGRGRGRDDRRGR